MRLQLVVFVRTTRTWATTVLLLLLLLGTATRVVVVQASNEEGLQFLAENKQKEGVIELPSGMQYKVLEKGTGLYHPLPSTQCKCHYAGTLIDGTEFDSSYGRGSPTTFAPNQVIPGWTEAMQMMVEGDKLELYIPSELAYGERGSPPKIPPDSVLIFTIEIVEILGGTDGLPVAAKCVAATGDKCDEKEKTYLTKIGSWTDEKKAAELARLRKMALEKTSMKPDLAHWIVRRSKILEQLVDGGGGGAGETASGGEKEGEL